MQDRWNALLNFVSPTGTGQNGKQGYALHNQESPGEYGRYSLDSYAITNASSALMGRDMWNETTAFKSGVLQTIYNTALMQNLTIGTWDGFTWSDDGNFSDGASCGTQGHNGPDGNGGCRQRNQAYGDFMQAAATEFSGINIGKYARTWITNVNPAIAPMFSAVDPGGSSLLLSGLPLDFYSSGAQYMYAHDNWTTSGTTLLRQMGLNAGTANSTGDAGFGGNQGHAHNDAGGFQVNRKGVNVIRETPGYVDTIAGYNGVGTVDAATGFAHNMPLVGGLASLNVFNALANGRGEVARLETQAGYSFAAVNLTDTYQNTISDPGHPERQNPYVVSLVREYYYFRGINVLVIVDRFQNDTASRSTTFSSHCETNPTVFGVHTTCVDGTQEAYYTALLPSAPAIAIVNESANGATDLSWQYRIESNNSNPGSTVNYQINTIQFGDTSGFSALTPNAVDSAPGTPATGTFTITLDGSNSLVLNKGIASAGGTIKAAGTTNSLASTVENMSINGTGNVWGNVGVAPPTGVSVIVFN